MNTSSPELVKVSPSLTDNQETLIPQSPEFSNDPVKRGGGSLRQRLLLTVVPTTLIPLVVVSLIGINFTRYQEQQNQLTKMENIAFVTKETTQIFLENISKNNPQIQNNNPLIIQGIKDILARFLGFQLSGSQILQLIDGNTGKILTTLTPQDVNLSTIMTEDNTLGNVAKIFSQSLQAKNSPTVLASLKQLREISKVRLENSRQKTDTKLLIFEYQGRYFNFIPIPNSNIIVSISINQGEITQIGGELIILFISISIFLGFLAVANIILLAQTLSQPLMNLTNKVQRIVSGDLNVRADLEGTEENRTLADNFNILIQKVNELLKEQEIIANEQRQEKEKLEQDIYQLLDELQYAIDGDLTVRASLTSMEMSTIADLCNAMLDNLQEIAVQVKESSVEVSSSLGENEQSIQLLAEQTLSEADETRKTLKSVQQMSLSIQQVATNANQAATLADDAYSLTQEGSKVIDETVASILSLRSKVGNTAKKMKRLGESSQNISQVVSLIQEIALKTNLLAINASVEASRAGEQGQGFTIVAEQVGALAQQSASATKQIAQLVAEIQQETQEVTLAMEAGTSQVVNTTRLVESTKQRLEQVLNRSRSINELMKNISQSTVSQAKTSRLVTELMKQIAQQSEERLNSSLEIAKSIKATAQVAQQMESVVEQFKVE
ncbi:HAMP domain-containing methyl-accepting chemotaxis protein [Geminocystis sp. GBBB08]|uniref:methyl-accepting chemotaxis protein n=1 Tax=Geminocystis sp. GBBB08 TaxID=2604140 RepID=UPI0027E27D63|nr:HAMP domain-containing methyl-accepting chemotaxis protein [Geminocystis sp. GBBB08]